MRQQVFSLSQIGESATKIPRSVREAHPEIDWDQLIDLSHAIISAFDEIDRNRLWQCIQEDVPDLAERLPPILAEAQAEMEASRE